MVLARAMVLARVMVLACALVLPRVMMLANVILTPFDHLTTFTFVQPSDCFHHETSHIVLSLKLRKWGSKN